MGAEERIRDGHHKDRRRRSHDLVELREDKISSEVDGRGPRPCESEDSSTHRDGNQAQTEVADCDVNGVKDTEGDEDGVLRSRESPRLKNAAFHEDVAADRAAERMKGREGVWKGKPNENEFVVERKGEVGEEIEGKP